MPKLNDRRLSLLLSESEVCGVGFCTVLGGCLIDQALASEYARVREIPQGWRDVRLSDRLSNACARHGLGVVNAPAGAERTLRVLEDAGLA